MTDAVTEKWFIGEAVMPKYFKTMEWLPFDEAFERIATHSFLARFDRAPDGRLSLEGQPSGNGGAQRDEHSYGTQRTKDDPRTQGQAPANRPSDLDDDIPF